MKKLSNTEAALKESVAYKKGCDSLAFRGSLLCNSLPSNIKQSHTLEEFKLKLRNLGKIRCTCLVFR